MLSLTRTMASARRRARSVGLRKMKKARRCAVLGPTLGSLDSSSIRAATGGAISLIVLEQSRDFHASSSVPDEFLLSGGRFVKGILGSSFNHDFQLGDIFGRKRFGVNFDVRDFKFAAHRDSDRATASSAGKQGGF